MSIECISADISDTPIVSLLSYFEMIQFMYRSFSVYKICRRRGQVCNFSVIKANFCPRLQKESGLCGARQIRAGVTYVCVVDVFVEHVL